MATSEALLPSPSDSKKTGNGLLPTPTGKGLLPNPTGGEIETKIHAGFALTIQYLTEKDARSIVNSVRYTKACTPENPCSKMGEMPKFSKDEFESKIGLGCVHVVLAKVSKKGTIKSFVFPSQHIEWESDFPISGYHTTLLKYGTETLRHHFKQAQSNGLECWIWMALMPGGSHRHVKRDGTQGTKRCVPRLEIFGGKIDLDDSRFTTKQSYESPKEFEMRVAKHCVRREINEESNGIITVPRATEPNHSLQWITNYLSVGCEVAIFAILINDSWVCVPETATIDDLSSAVANTHITEPLTTMTEQEHSQGVLQMLSHSMTEQEHFQGLLQKLTNPTPEQKHFQGLLQRLIQSDSKTDPNEHFRQLVKKISQPST